MKLQQEQRQIAEMLHEFEKSIGRSFILTGDGEMVKTSFTDTIIGINRELQLVIGEVVEAPVIWCQMKNATTLRKRPNAAPLF